MSGTLLVVCLIAAAALLYYHVIGSTHDDPTPDAAGTMAVALAKAPQTDPRFNLPLHWEVGNVVEPESELGLVLLAQHAPGATTADCSTRKCTVTVPTNFDTDSCVIVSPNDFGTTTYLPLKKHRYSAAALSARWPQLVPAYVVETFLFTGDTPPEDASSDYAFESKVTAGYWWSDRSYAAGDSSQAAHIVMALLSPAYALTNSVPAWRTAMQDDSAAGLIQSYTPPTDSDHFSSGFILQSANEDLRDDLRDQTEVVLKQTALNVGDGMLSDTPYDSIETLLQDQELFFIGLELMAAPHPPADNRSRVLTALSKNREAVQRYVSAHIKDNADCDSDAITKWKQELHDRCEKLALGLDPVCDCINLSKPLGATNFVQRLINSIHTGAGARCLADPCMASAATASFAWPCSVMKDCETCQSECSSTVNVCENNLANYAKDPTFNIVLQSNCIQCGEQPAKCDGGAEMPPSTKGFLLIVGLAAATLSYAGVKVIMA